MITLDTDQRMMNWQKRGLSLALVMILVLARLLPHPPNFSPIGASGLFFGARFRGWEMFAPLLVLFLSDLVIGLYAPSMMLIVYLSVLPSILYGRLVLAHNPHWFWLIIAPLFSASSFFVLSNLGEFFLFYPHTVAGFVTCFVRALPFYHNTLLGDICYGYGIFFCWQLFSQRWRTVALRL